VRTPTPVRVCTLTRPRVGTPTPNGPTYTKP
jgi:hypothetical protein